LRFRSWLSFDNFDLRSFLLLSRRLWPFTEFNQIPLLDESPDLPLLPVKPGDNLIKRPTAFLDHMDGPAEDARREEWPDFNYLVGQ
jgi:hypothetical protein